MLFSKILTFVFGVLLVVSSISANDHMDEKRGADTVKVGKRNTIG